MYSKVTKNLVQQHLIIRLLYFTSNKKLLHLKINIASGFGCFASVTPIAKGVKRYGECLKLIRFDKAKGFDHPL
jgi:hypothetical protein